MERRGFGGFGASSIPRTDAGLIERLYGACPTLEGVRRSGGGRSPLMCGGALPGWDCMGSSPSVDGKCDDQSLKRQRRTQRVTVASAGDSGSDGVAHRPLGIAEVAGLQKLVKKKNL
jgi:hypothetical protein